MKENIKNKSITVRITKEERSLIDKLHESKIDITKEFIKYLYYEHERVIEIYNRIRDPCKEINNKNKLWRRSTNGTKIYSFRLRLSDTEKDILDKTLAINGYTYSIFFGCFLKILATKND